MPHEPRAIRATRPPPTGPGPATPAPGSDPRGAFALAPGTTYLDAATYGPLPVPAAEAMREALEAMTSGSGRWIEDWDAPAEACRSDVAALSGVPEASVALLPAISVGAALVAAGLGPTDEVVVPSDEFTSILFPLLAARAGGATVREVPFAELASAVGPRTTLVAASLVQMQTGRRADLRGLLDACERVDARVLLDATQALPFLDAAEDLGRIDYVLTHAYKHLLCPRGVAFMFVRRDRLEGLLPLAANWRAADRPYERFFGGPLTLGPGARRFDVSLAWLSWVGARESLRLLREWQAQGSLDSVRQRADRLADSARQVLRGRGCGASSGAESTLVCLAVSDRAAARAALERAGVRAAIRGDAVRLSVHVWNDEADIDRAVAALAPHLAHG